MEKYNPAIHHRRSIRLNDYDYSQEGAYFVTICTYQRLELFGKIKENVMFLDHRGEIAHNMWDTLPERFPGVELDHCIVMPNHIHGILVRTQRLAPKIVNTDIKKIHNQPSTERTNMLLTSRKSPYRTQMLYEMIRAFKAVTSYHVRRSGQTPEFGWQREYYEHIIRDSKELDRIRTYIINNPSRWQQDKLHPLSTWHLEQKLSRPNHG